MRKFLITGLLFVTVTQILAQPRSVDVLVIGGGASGTMAAIQAAREGATVLLAEETTWLGGMLTSAGVSAIDGNHRMPSGLWGEFRQKLYDQYGGPKAVETGWVSNTLFEPSKGNEILRAMVEKERVPVLFNTHFVSLSRSGGKWKVMLRSGRKRHDVTAAIVIDGTELGDVAAAAGAAYRIGMDAASESGEPFAPEKENDIIQDLTYVMILKDYGVDQTIPKPAGYDKRDFECACEGSPGTDGKPSANCRQMMQYGRLPNDKYMINWPRCGNDYYLNLIEKTPEERSELLKEAKLHSLRFLYYLQTELGFRTFGLVRDEFPTADHFPMIPYHRESRRIKGMAELNVMHVARPFDQQAPLYRTGIAVGDYPIDHHHDKNPDAPKIDFINIKVPSYNVPLGALIPADVEGLIVAEKSISVTNIVNGATRLQPVVMTIGQAAGALAAVCVRNNLAPSRVSVRAVQAVLLKHGAYLMPFCDVSRDHVAFAAIQRVAATGILRGRGVPYKWANQTWFYPDQPVNEFDLVKGMRNFYSFSADVQGSGAFVTPAYFSGLVKAVAPAVDSKRLGDALAAVGAKGTDTPLTRAQLARLIDDLLNPFAAPVDFEGRLLTPAEPQQP